MGYQGSGSTTTFANCPWARHCVALSNGHAFFGETPSHISDHYEPVEGPNSGHTAPCQVEIVIDIFIIQKCTCIKNERSYSTVTCNAYSFINSSPRQYPHILGHPVLIPRWERQRSTEHRRLAL